MTSLYRTLQSFVSTTRKNDSAANSLIKDNGLKNAGWDNISAIIELLYSNGFDTTIIYGCVNDKPAKRSQYNGMSYRDLQAHNTQAFKALDKELRKELKAQGYRNSGWENMIRSYELLNEVKPNNIIQLPVKSDDSDDELAIAQSDNVVPLHRTSKYYEKLADKYIPLGDVAKVTHLLDISNKLFLEEQAQESAKYEAKREARKAKREARKAEFEAAIVAIDEDIETKFAELEDLADRYYL